MCGVIDSHAHVDAPRFDDDRDAVLARARAAGVRGIVAVGCDLPTTRRATSLAERERLVVATAGIHPLAAGDATDEDLDALRELAAHPRIVAIGECGLDQGPHNSASLAAQERVFRAQIQLARELDLPLVIHNRDTYPELFTILTDEARRGPLRGIMHCFSGDAEQARRSVELGFHVSFSGVVTFKNAPLAREAARATPLDRLLVETDCPYLAPTPHRGRRNEPAYVALVLEFLAELLDVPVAELDRRTEQNTLDAYGLRLEDFA